MEDFLNSVPWFIISLTFTLFGVVTGGIGIYQGVRSNKELKQYKYLFKIAGQNMDLDDKEKTLKDYNKKIKSLKEAIEEQIPVEAEKIAIKGILENEIQELSNCYSKVLALETKLKNINNSEQDFARPNDLVKKVEQKIKPRYIQNRKSNLFNLLFFLMSVVSSFASMILPHNLYRLSTVGILLVQVIMGISLIKNHIKLNYSKEEIKSAIHSGVGILSISFALISIFILVTIFFDKLIDLFITILFSYIFYIIHFVLWVIFCRNKYKKKTSFIIFFVNIIVAIVNLAMLFGVTNDNIIAITIAFLFITLLLNLFLLIRLFYLSHKNKNRPSIS